MVHHSCYLNISFEADRLLFFGSWAVCRARCAALLGGYCLHSVSSCAVRAALNPLFLSAARISASLRRTTFRRMHSI